MLDLKVGDRVKTNGDGKRGKLSEYLVGVVGEIRDKGFFIFHDNSDYDTEFELSNSPEDYGYNYAWYIRFDNPNATTCKLPSEPRVEVRPRVRETIVVKEVNKSMLQTVTNALKRFLNANAQVQYRAGYIDGGLELTERGTNALLVILAKDNEKALTESANEFIAEAEAKKKGGC